MAERKQGPVKPPTIDLTARDASAEGEKPARRSARKAAAESVEAQADGAETVAAPQEAPTPHPIPPTPPTPPEPPRVIAAPPPWGMLGTAALAGALLGTALTYVLATLVPLPAPPVRDLAPELSVQADRLTTLEERLSATEAGTIDVRAAIETGAGDAAARLTALEGRLAELDRTAGAPPDTSAIEARLRTLTSRVDAIAAGASSADAGAMADNIGDLEEALAVLQSEVAALRSEIEIAAAEPEPEPPPPSTGIPVLLATLESAFATGQPYATALAALQAQEPPVAVDGLLVAEAGTGLVRPDVLERQFAEAVPLILAARPPSGAGWQDAAGDLVSSLLAIRPAGETEGETPEAIVSRIEGAMSRHDYAAAGDLLAELPPEMVAAAGTVPAGIAAHAAAARLVSDLRARTAQP